AQVSLEVAQGESVASVGSNGGGKSSLVRTIAVIEVPRNGRILFKENAINGLGSHHICNRGIGQVADGRQVFPSLTVLENLEVGAMLPRARATAKRCLEEVFGMFPRLAARPAQLAV